MIQDSLLESWRRMGWTDWFRRKQDGTDEKLRAWRNAWSTAAAAGERTALAALRRDLEMLSLPEEEIELEREMLEGFRQAAELSERIDAAGLPIVPTGHRIVGHEPCHFIAPASLADDPLQPSGRILLTARRALFAGGGATVAMAWHTIGEAVHAERDLVLICVDRQRAFRFRCNTFADAMCGAVIARRLGAAAKRKL